VQTVANFDFQAIWSSFLSCQVIPVGCFVDESCWKCPGEVVGIIGCAKYRTEIGYFHEKWRRNEFRAVFGRLQGLFVKNTFQFHQFGS